MSLIFKREHSYCHIDMTKQFSIILPFKNICYPSKNSGSMKKNPGEVKHLVNEKDMHKNNSVMTLTAVILSVVNMSIFFI